MTRTNPQWQADAATIIEDEYSFTAEERETMVNYDCINDVTHVYSNNPTDITKYTNLPTFHVVQMRVQPSGNISAVKGVLYGHHLTVRK